MVSKKGKSKSRSKDTQQGAIEKYLDKSSKKSSKAEPQLVSEPHPSTSTATATPDVYPTLDQFTTFLRDLSSEGKTTPEICFENRPLIPNTYNEEFKDKLKENYEKQKKGGKKRRRNRSENFWIKVGLENALPVHTTAQGSFLK